ncbi:MAG TPA: SDR family NAD(P)-dependent oxidoreductase, partial [Methanocella sp.]
MLDLTGRTAVITGAGSGIGATVAKTLFGQNASVALLARTESNVKKVADGFDPGNTRSACYACDVKDEASLEKVRDAIIGDLGKIDILVTCAAAPGASGKSEELSFKDWKMVMDTDLDGVFLCCKVFGKEMIR